MEDEITFLAFDFDPWRFVEVVTLRQATCLLCRTLPKRDRGTLLEANAEAMELALKQAILMRTLEPFATWVYHPMAGELVPCDIDELTPHDHVASETTVRTEALRKWCDERGIWNPWQAANLPVDRTPAAALTHYPGELQAAIDAFNAVHGNDAALRGKSPRQALSAWLSDNCPELSSKARDRIATVANWEPGGGAPKTPGGT